MSPEVITYYVNGENESTDQQKLTVAQILAGAGFQPTDQYQLIRDEGSKKFDNQSEEVPLHNGERFTALFLGPTPTS
jgi:phenylalanyl-tRNA synthetase beta subunit